MTDAGAAMLAAAIGSSAQITHLDLGGNRIGNAGAAALAWAVGASPTITELLLDDNSPECSTGTYPSGDPLTTNGPNCDEVGLGVRSGRCATNN